MFWGVIRRKVVPVVGWSASKVRPSISRPGHYNTAQNEALIYGISSQNVQSFNYGSHVYSKPGRDANVVLQPEYFIRPSHRSYSSGNGESRGLADHITSLSLFMPLS